MANLRRKIVIKTDNTEWLKSSGGLNVYKIRTIDKKTHQPRIIVVETDKDLIQAIHTHSTPIEIVFYVPEDQLNLLVWNIGPNCRININRVIARVYSSKIRPNKHKLEIFKTHNNDPTKQKPHSEVCEVQKRYQKDYETQPEEEKGRPLFFEAEKHHNFASEGINNLFVDKSNLPNEGGQRIFDNSNTTSEQSKKTDILWQEQLEKRISFLEKEIEGLLLKQNVEVTKKESSEDQIGEIKDLLLDFVNKQTTTKPYFSDTDETGHEGRAIKSRRNWKHRGFARIQAYFNIRKIRLTNTKKINGKTLNTYIFNAKVLKKPRTITLQTTEKFQNNTNVNFYIRRELIDDDNWNINDFDNQMTFFAHTQQST